LKCGGVLMLPPFYYKNMNDQGLFASFSEVIQRVGDSNLHVYLYHIPPQTNVPITLKLIEMLTKAYPETVVGLKDSGGDWNNTAAVISNFPGFAVFPGRQNHHRVAEAIRRGGDVEEQRQRSVPQCGRDIHHPIRPASRARRR